MNLDPGYNSKEEILHFIQRRQDELDRELTRCGSRDKIMELRKYVLFIQEKLREMELLDGPKESVFFDGKKVGFQH
jgi:hypothetical protein